ncbi:hypothetical protein ND747_26940, partial [Frankia sp. R82]|nr:hypothetical protein [Frankia sp. R82]
MIAEEMPGVDASVARLRAASAELAATLIELDAHPGRVLFDPSRCTGTTAARATVALDRLAWLWERYLALFDLLTRVDATASRRANRRREHIFALLRAAGGTLRGDPPHPEPGDHVPTLTSGQPAADELGLAAVATTMARVRADLDAVVAAHREQVAVLGGAEEQLARLTAATTRIG